MAPSKPPPTVPQAWRRYGPWAVVLGASEGLGAAYAESFARRGLNVVCVARREAKLREFCSALADRSGVTLLPLALDLENEDAAEHLDRALRGAGIGEADVGLVVFNACASAAGKEFTALSLEAKMQVLNINCRSLLAVVHLFAPRLVARGKGGFILMSSMAGFHGTALAATYCASKAFATVLGEALWAELQPKGIDVRVCAAGATRTPNFFNTTPSDKQASVFPLDPATVVAAAVASMLRGKRCGPLVVPGFVNRTGLRIMRMLGSRGAVNMMSGQMRKLYHGAGAV